jgi:ketosteroid isomerase-like protein
VEAEPLDPVVQQVVDAERAFAHLAVEKGMREAFLANLAEDAILFRPGPVLGRKWFEERPASSGKLAWEPDFAAVSSSGDLGYTSGPWTYTEGDAEPVHGHFVTVWRLDAKGAWKVAIDGGVRHAETPPGWKLVVGADLTRPSEAPSRHALDELQRADRELAHSGSQEGKSAAILARAADGLRVYRVGHLPLIDPKAIRSLPLRTGRWTSAPEGGGISSAGDLGWTYGTEEFVSADAAFEAPEKFAYLRIWNRSEGTPRILLDVESPIPAPKRTP